VDVSFGGVRALADVSLEVRAGSVTGLIGPNGAGKTTLFNVVTGLLRPDQGRVSLDGHDITRLPPHRRAAMGVGRTFQRLELFGTLTVRENVLMAAETRENASSARRRCEDLLNRVGLEPVADEPADLVPTGLARLVELARALACRPAVLLLDEPSSGLGSHETDRLGRLLVDLAAEGMAVLLVEHDMRLVMDVCTDVTVLDFGRVIARGPAQAVRDDPLVQTAYLGEPNQNGQRLEARSIPPSGPEPRSPALELRGISASYGRIQAVRDVSLRIDQGSVFALLGPNGAGKSTLLKVASGRLDPSGGNVELMGADVTHWAAARLARAGLCTIPEGRPIFPNLTVAENIRMFTYHSRHQRVASLEERSFERFPILAQRRSQLAGTLSGGEQQMLALARALSTDPRVLLVDELSMGLAPLVVDQLYEVLAALAQREQLAVLVVEQFAEMALAIAERAAVMVNGGLVLEGSPAEVADAVVEAYMGAGST
jgi:ABC-type branched-subunit amino acid transport system ATPase component